MRYDASDAPDPKAWLELDETERIDLIIDYHDRRNLPVGESARFHGVTHMIVENHVALGGATLVPVTLDRLMDEGLDRHEAIHAIASVLMGLTFDVVLHKTDDAGDLNTKYGRELTALTATGWRAQ
jgi:hypothetical protein